MKFQIPLPLKLAALVVGTTVFYTYMGQLVPQKEVHPPPERTDISNDVTPDELAQIGKEIAGGKGQCLICHTIGQSGSGLPEGSALIESHDEGISQDEGAAPQETLEELLDQRMRMGGLPGYR